MSRRESDRTPLNAPRSVRIGGASGFWGDSILGPRQLVEYGDLDYLVFDYLAETTMAILAEQRRRDASRGYATDFVEVAMTEVMAGLFERGIRVISNAGGLNPRGCAKALADLAKRVGVPLRIAVVEGDDVLERVRSIQICSMHNDAQLIELPTDALSANVYLGAFPIARALAANADVVITGRCADSALVLGPLIHEFDWQTYDYDRLAAGSLAGHIIECGCQATGGLFTDWERVPDWPNIGYPIVDCGPDGSFEVMKPPSTGGLIDPATIAEQMVYEIGDPAAYLLPDVTCDFSDARIRACGRDRVHVSGVRGKAPSATYKLSATLSDGFRSQAMLMIIGRDADAKAQRTGSAILERTRRIFAERGLPDYLETRVEVIGAESVYGPHARKYRPREVVMRVAVAHSSRQALEIFAREIAPAATSWAPGTTTPPWSRPAPAPRILQVCGLVSKADVPVQITIDGRSEEVRAATFATADSAVSCQVVHAAADFAPTPGLQPDEIEVPLLALAHARSGDKGDISNIGVIARRPEYLPIILEQLTPTVVLNYFSYLAAGPVRRFVLPGISACNFVIDNALSGGGSSSLRMDPLGKGMAQMLLDIRVHVPRALAQTLLNATD